MRIIAGVSVVLSIISLAAGCEITDPTGTLEVTVELINGEITEGEAIHILRPGEGFAASNRLEPGQKRIVSVGLDRSGDEGVGFRAGREGVEIGNVTCFSQNPPAVSADLGAVATVLWTGTVLECRGWDG